MISSVDFFANGTPIGTVTASPYDFTWADVPVGHYNLTAEVTDSNGVTATSSPEVVSVAPTASTAPQLHVSGNKLVDANGNQVIPRGVDRSRHNLAASWHSCNFNTCDTQSCWTSEVAPVIAQVPVIAGEIGENDCAGTYINPLTSWLDSEGASYLAWAWNADFNCSSGSGLITDYQGDPTGFGAAYQAHLASLGL